jgi:hypothetical protein
MNNWKYNESFSNDQRGHNDSELSLIAVKETESKCWQHDNTGCDVFPSDSLLKKCNVYAYVCICICVCVSMLCSL